MDDGPREGFLDTPQAEAEDTVINAEYRYWCELQAARFDEPEAMTLAAEPTTTPRLTLRWLQWHADRAAQELDPAPGDPHRLAALRVGLPAAWPDVTQSLRAWVADHDHHEHVLAELRAGRAYTLRASAPFVSLTAAPLREPHEPPLGDPRTPRTTAEVPGGLPPSPPVPQRAPHGTVRCPHPPERCTTTDSLIICRCGARRFPDYHALGVAALDIGGRPASSTATQPAVGTSTLHRHLVGAPAPAP